MNDNTLTYTYDPAGNRNQQQDDVGTITLYDYDDANRLERERTTGARTTFTYDNNGNQVTRTEPSGDITTNTWDYENQNTRVELPSGDIVTYTYNSDEMRIGRTDPGGLSTTFIWDAENILSETDAVGDFEARYTYQPAVKYGNLVSQSRDSDSSFYHFDALGSTSALTDDTEVITDTYAYTAWGELHASDGTTFNPYQWVGSQGYRIDPDTGRHHLRRREYEADFARFLSEDPLHFSGGDENLYRYVKNDPLGATDPSGKSFQMISAEPWEGNSWQESARAITIMMEGNSAGAFVGNVANYDYENEEANLIQRSVPQTRVVSRSEARKSSFFLSLAPASWRTVQERGNLSVKREELQKAIDGGELTYRSTDTDIDNWFRKVRVGPSCPKVSVLQRIACGIFGLFSDEGGAAFCTKFGEFAGNLGIFLKKGAGYLAKILKTFGLALINGVNKFCLGDDSTSTTLGEALNCTKAFDRLMAVVQEWVGDKYFDAAKDLVDAFTENGATATSVGSKVLTIVFDLVGFSLDGLIDMLAEAFPTEVNLLMGAIEQINDALDAIEKAGGPWEWVSGKVEEFANKDTIWNAVKGGWQNIAQSLLVSAFLKFASMFAGPTGAIIAWAKTVYDGVKWVIDNKAAIGELWNKLTSFFSDLIKNPGASVLKLGGDVFAIIKSFFPKALGFVAKLIAGVDIPTKIQDVLKNVTDAFRNPVIKFLKKIGGYLKQALNSVLAKFGITSDRQVLVAEESDTADGKLLVSAEATGSGIEIYVTGSPTVTVEAFIKKVEECDTATAAQIAAARTEANNANQTATQFYKSIIAGKSTSSIERESRKAGKKSARAKLVKEAKDLKDLLQTQAKSLADTLNKLRKDFDVVGDSGRLTTRLNNSGTDSNPGGHAAHHIVESWQPGAQQSRDILYRFCIGINDADNGVFLPDKCDPSITNKSTRVHHNCTKNSQSYSRYVARRLASAATQAKVVDILDEIREELKSGYANWLDPPQFVGADCGDVAAKCGGTSVSP